MKILLILLALLTCGPTIVRAWDGEDDDATACAIASCTAVLDTLSHADAVPPPPCPAGPSLEDIRQLLYRFQLVGVIDPKHPHRCPTTFKLVDP